MHFDGVPWLHPNRRGPRVRGTGCSCDWWPRKLVGGLGLSLEADSTLGVGADQAQPAWSLVSSTHSPSPASLGPALGLASQEAPRVHGTW